jgi:MFS family permease
MAGTATALINGKLFGAFDAKRLYILVRSVWKSVDLSLANHRGQFSIVFLVGSVLCGVAGNLPTLIVGRIIGGIGVG